MDKYWLQTLTTGLKIQFIESWNTTRGVIHCYFTSTMKRCTHNRSGNCLHYPNWRAACDTQSVKQKKRKRNPPQEDELTYKQTKKRWCCESAALNMPANLEHSAVATGLEKVSFHVFISIPKKGNARECSNYCTIAVISHTSKVMLKILQARHQQYMNHELPNVWAGYRKGGGGGSRDQIASIRWIIKKVREFQKIIFSALLTMP